MLLEHNFPGNGLLQLVACLQFLYTHLQKHQLQHSNLRCCRYQQELYFYLTPRGILFTPSGASVTEIPFNSIRKMAIKKGRIVNWYHIRFVADKKYHFYIHCKEVFSTELTGDASENVKAFIETLRLSVKNN